MSDPARATSKRHRRWPAFLAVVAIIIALPVLMTSGYWRGIMILCTLNILLAMSLNLILGYAGQLNLGHSAFYGVGAYVTTLLVRDLGVNFWGAVLCGSIAAAAVGVVLAFFAGRLRGHYLGIASLGLGVIAYEVLMNWSSVTSGPLGIYGILPPPSIDLGIFVLDFEDPAMLFYLMAAIALLVFVVLDNLVRSPIGYTLRSVREDEVSAGSLGVWPQLWKIFVFGFGGAIAGLAGGFYPGFVGTLVPDAFNIIESFFMLAMVIVGGAGTMLGPVIGAILLTVLPELLRGIGDWRLLVYGLSLTLVVLFLPGGIVQGFAQILARWRTEVPSEENTR